jgi:hypothetical protein
MHKFLTASVLTLTTLAATLAGTLATTAANAADTSQCAAAVNAPHGNPPAQWCAGQELVTLGLGLAAPNKAVAYAQLLVKPWTTTNGNEDFAVYPPAPGQAPTKVFEFAPKGVLSGLCAALNNKHTKVVLKTCNVTSKGQQFQPGSTSADGGNSWDSLLTGQAMTASGGAFSGVVLSGDAGTTHQGFTYQQ